MPNPAAVHTLEFMRLNQADPRVFGFPEFLAGLALMILAWTIADTRYRFRVRVAPIDLTLITFVVVALLGVLTLLTDIWRAAGWRVLKGGLLTPITWQLILAATFLLTFLTWAWYALIKRPVFGRGNARRFAGAMAGSLLRGSMSEIAIIAEDVEHSARNLVKMAPDVARDRRTRDGHAVELTRLECFAMDVLQVLADRRFCRAISETCPSTALAIFMAMRKTGRFSIPVHVFAKNLVNEAISNENSFLYHEADWYDTGFLGQYQPLSQAMFSDWRMVEKVGTMLTADYPRFTRWKSSQWEAYCRVVTITWNDFAKAYTGEHSSSLYAAISQIKDLPRVLYRGLSEEYDEGTAEAFAVVASVTEFLTDATVELNASAERRRPSLRVKDARYQDFYDHLAEAMQAVIFHASKATSDKWRWDVQHNETWSKFFGVSTLEGPAGKVVKHKLRRLLYDEVTRLARSPNFVGSSILGLCLNVLGLTLYRSNHSKDTYALQKVVLNWTKKNFAALYTASPAVAENCVATGGLQYDPATRSLTKTTRIPIHRAARVQTLVVDGTVP